MRKWLGYALGVRTTIATAAVVGLVVVDHDDSDHVHASSSQS
jgi:hypothetical protein